MKAEINLGKVAFGNYGKCINPVVLDVELTDRGGEETLTYDGKKTGNHTPKYTELTISAMVYGTGDKWGNHGCICAGQCLDEINKSRKSDTFNRALWNELYKFWKRYHLNGMHAGTREQERIIKEWTDAGNQYDYSTACALLKERGKYTVNFTGKTVGKAYHDEPYTYGCGWVINDIPRNVIDRVTEIIKEHQ